MKSIPVACRSGHSCDAAHGENSLTCPENCAASAADNICNPVKDGQCDPDCVPGVDTDCSSTPSSLPVLIGGAAVFLVIAAGAGWYLMKKKKGGSP